VGLGPSATQIAVCPLGDARFLLALLLSLCTAVIPVSGIRLAVGLTASASVSGICAQGRESYPQPSARVRIWGGWLDLGG
jgi:hypothetical protein